MEIFTVVVGVVTEMDRGSVNEDFHCCGRCSH